MSKTIKFRDLTIDQAIKIKDRCSNYKSCKECKEKDESCYKLCNVSFVSSKDILDLEIEVEDNA